MSAAIYRSYLYVPAHKARAVAHAYASAADAVILDLEDAVPPAEKNQARDAAAEILSAPTAKPTYVRINGLTTPWARDDVFAIAKPALRALRLPKCERPEQIQQVAAWLDACDCAASIQILIESAYGVEHAMALATASPRLERIGLGESDLRSDLRIGAENPTMDACRTRCVIVSRAAGLANPIQTVYHRLHDAEGFRRSTLDGKAMGYFGRLVIHPSHVDVVNEIYTPSHDEIAEARAIVDAAQAAMRDGERSSVFVLPGGKVVAPPLVANARVVLALAQNLALVGAAT